MSYTFSDDEKAIGWCELNPGAWPPPDGWEPPEDWLLWHRQLVKDLGPLELPRRGEGEPSPLDEPPGHGWIQHRQPRRSEALAPTWFVAATAAPAVRLDRDGRIFWTRLGMGPHQAQLRGLVGGPLLYGHQPEKCCGWVLAAKRKDAQALVQIAWPQAAEQAWSFHGRVRAQLLAGELGLSLGVINLCEQLRPGRVSEACRWVATEVSATPTPAVAGTGPVRHG